MCGGWGDNVCSVADTVVPRRLGPKRATRIRKLFALEKGDNLEAYRVKREIEREGKKPTIKAPKIQRLVTPARLQRKRARIAANVERVKVKKEQMAEYVKTKALRAKQAKERRAEQASKRRSQNSATKSK